MGNGVLSLAGEQQKKEVHHPYTLEKLLFLFCLKENALPGVIKHLESLIICSVQAITEEWIHVKYESYIK